MKNILLNFLALGYLFGCSAKGVTLKTAMEKEVIINNENDLRTSYFHEKSSHTNRLSSVS